MEGDTLTCKRCKSTWVQRGTKKPKTCAKCNTPYWEKEITPYWQKIREQNKLRKA
jgi:protein-arginine kinase activator protein McsA